MAPPIPITILAPRIEASVTGMTRGTFFDNCRYAWRPCIGSILLSPTRSWWCKLMKYWFNLLGWFGYWKIGVLAFKRASHDLVRWKLRGIDWVDKVCVRLAAWCLLKNLNVILTDYGRFFHLLKLSVAFLVSVFLYFEVLLTSTEYNQKKIVTE